MAINKTLNSSLYFTRSTFTVKVLFSSHSDTEFDETDSLPRVVLIQRDVIRRGVRKVMCWLSKIPCAQREDICCVQGYGMKSLGSGWRRFLNSYQVTIREPIGYK